VPLRAAAHINKEPILSRSQQRFIMSINGRRGGIRGTVQAERKLREVASPQLTLRSGQNVVHSVEISVYGCRMLI
jgi:hypothetical protein